MWTFQTIPSVWTWISTFLWGGEALSLYPYFVGWSIPRTFEVSHSKLFPKSVFQCFCCKFVSRPVWRGPIQELFVPHPVCKDLYCSCCDILSRQPPTCDTYPCISWAIIFEETENKNGPNIFSVTMVQLVENKRATFRPHKVFKTCNHIKADQSKQSKIVAYIISSTNTNTPSVPLCTCSLWVTSQPPVHFSSSRAASGLTACPFKAVNCDYCSQC